jgi:hypothetical protein
MNIAISKEDKEVLYDLANELMLVKQKSIQLSYYLLLGLKKYIENFIISLGEYSPQEIKTHGLEAILIRRALRFFGLANDDHEDQRRPRQKKKKKLTVIRIVKKVILVPLLPLYLLILMLYKIRRKNTHRNVKNNYET